MSRTQVFTSWGHSLKLDWIVLTASNCGEGSAVSAKRKSEREHGKRDARHIGELCVGTEPKSTQAILGQSDVLHEESSSSRPLDDVFQRASSLVGC